jgi:hypothetical protein
MLAPIAAAQDFASAAPAGPAPGACALLERALPVADGGAALECGTTRWLALPDLQTRAVAAILRAGSVRVAAGMSQTGDPAIGWTAAALALGAVSEEGGVALRVVARRDRDEGAVAGGHLERGAGGEAGAGAWLAAAPALLLWASAPQLWTAGESPPLVRPLELGARASFSGGAAWCALVAPRSGDDGERVAGLSLGGAALAVWGEARDGPLRASLGLSGRVGALVVEASVDAHPVLGETTHLSLAWRPRGAREAP